jgi:uncharacterized protein VirK/YbjX
LRKTLEPLYNHQLICPKTKVYYLFSYLSSSLNTRNKLKIIEYHYAFLQSHFPFHTIQKIYTGGLILWSEIRDSNNFEITIVSPTPFEREGPLMINFNMNGISLYCLAFAFSPGECFGVEKNTIIFISRLQGTKRRLKEISLSTKSFGENKPSALLVSIAEGMALAMGIHAIVGICTENQVACVNTESTRKYERFWETFESTKINSGDYYLEVPIKNKDLSLIISKHRRRTLKKREIRKEICRKVYRYFYEMNPHKNEAGYIFPHVDVEDNQ